MKSALELFRSGHDTYDIHIILGIPEALVLEQLTKQRSADRGMKPPYAHIPNLSAARSLPQHPDRVYGIRKNSN